METHKLRYTPKLRYTQKLSWPEKRWGPGRRRWGRPTGALVVPHLAQTTPLTHPPAANPAAPRPCPASLSQTLHLYPTSLGLVLL